jgi:hypothetical protein
MIHVYPIGDTKEHDLYSTTCHCSPKVSFENEEMIVVHNSFDGREIIEEVNKILGNE